MEGNNKAKINIIIKVAVKQQNKLHYAPLLLKFGSILGYIEPKYTHFSNTFLLTKKNKI